MSNVIQFRRPVASHAVIGKLVDLGYLQPGKRHKDAAVQNALGRLRTDLCRDGIISSADIVKEIPKASEADG